MYTNYFWFTLPLLITAAILLIIGGYSLRFRSVPAAAPFALLMFLGAAWAVIYALGAIDENITEKILVNTLCRKAYLSRNAFFRLFKEQFGVTPLEYINHERIKLAKQLLASSNQSITQTGMQCGFTDVNYFVRIFRKVEGITPGAYQKCLRHN